MQFGLCNAASTFQRLVDEVLRGLSFVYAFIDDILVASSSEADHIQHLRLLFQRLDKYGLSINPSKCTFGVPTLNFLGFQICCSGIKPLEGRVEVILKFPKPPTITQLWRFLGMLNYYRRFIRQAAHILAPLVNFFKGIKNKKRPKRNFKIKPEEVLEWTDEATTAFELVKQSLEHSTLLHRPVRNAPLSIGADASDYAVGGALAQYHENVRPNIKHPCKRSKIHRHTKAPISTFALPEARFSQIHADFICLFSPSNGQSYCLTVVDRFTRWMEVIPTADMTAETVCRALLSVWIPRFGCPAIITTDQGTNFESSLFRELSNLLGTNRIRCCTYHPKSNSLVERLHRHLKSAIKAH
ncbi:retrovirus-related Pol polyprotein from transposon opus [Trichonephila clavipes]|nr:retrovirus-related Pol polyprotein from transposon opus [Trichonephila clavipes]